MKGVTSKLINKLVLSANECEDIAFELMNELSRPVQQINRLQYPYMNLLLEVNDMVMNWARFVFNDDLSYITGISNQWSIDQDSTSFNRDDSGLNFSDISDVIYEVVMDDEQSFVYAMVIRNNLTTDSEIDAASIRIYYVEGL